MIVPCIIAKQWAGWWAQLLLRRHNPKNRTMHRNMNACYVHLSYDAMRQSCHAVCKWSHMHRHTQTKLGTQQDLWNASRRFVTLRLLCKQHAVATRLFNESTGLHVGHITRSNIAYFITLHYIGSHSLWTIIILVVLKFSTFFFDFIVEELFTCQSKWK